MANGASTCSALDNDECHVTAFRPISEAADSWSYDKFTYRFLPLLSPNPGDVTAVRDST